MHTRGGLAPQTGRPMMLLGADSEVPKSNLIVRIITDELEVAESGISEDLRSEGYLHLDCMDEGVVDHTLTYDKSSGLMKEILISYHVSEADAESSIPPLSPGARRDIQMISM